MDGKVFNHMKITAYIADLAYGKDNWFYDLEGYPTPNSERQSMLHNFSAVRPNVSGIKGQVMIVGTSSNMEVEDSNLFFTSL